MSKNQALSIPTALSAEIGIDKSDLVAVQVAQVETNLIQAQADVEAQLRHLKKELVALNKTKQAEIDKVADKVSLTDIEKAMNALNFDVETTATARLNDKETQVVVAVQVVQGTGYNRATLMSERKFSVPKAVTKMSEAITTKQEELEELQVKLVDIRKRLSQIGTVERQAKAQLALTTMQNSEEGRALLEQIKQVKGLPGIE